MYVDAADDEEVGLSAERREVEANDRQSSLISPDGPATATRREGRSQRGGRRGEVAEGRSQRGVPLATVAQPRFVTKRTWRWVV